jgi:hypothetical protein
LNTLINGDELVEEQFSVISVGLCVLLETLVLGKNVVGSKE